MEYTLKKYNKEQAKSVAKLPMSKRWQYSDVKEKFTELTLKEYVDITNGLAAQMKGTLNETLDVKGAEASIAAKISKESFYIHPDTGERIDIDPDTTIDMLTAPKVPTCFAEDLVGHSIMSFQDRISKLNEKLLDNSNSYLEDSAKELSNISLPNGTRANIASSGFQAQNIETNMVSAFQFLNTKANIFDFESPRNEAVSDFYQFARGGASQPDSNIPNMKGVSAQIDHYMRPGNVGLSTGRQIPFLEPSKNQPDISWLEGRGSVTIADLENIPKPTNTKESVARGTAFRSADRIINRINNRGDRY